MVSVTSTQHIPASSLRYSSPRSEGPTAPSGGNASPGSLTLHRHRLPQYMLECANSPGGMANWNPDLAEQFTREAVIACEQKWSTVRLRGGRHIPRAALVEALETAARLAPGARNENEINTLLEELRTAHPGNSRSLEDDTDAAAESGELSDNLVDRIFALLTRLDKEWLTRFSDILSNYVAFFNKLTDALAKLSGSITGTGGNGDINVSFEEVRKALEALLKDTASHGLGGDFKTEAEAQEFLSNTLGLKELKVVEKPDGTWQLAIDSSMIQKMLDLFKNDGTMNPGAHAAIISAKDSLLEQFNHINRVLPDRYQRQLQAWDTLVKTLSATIDSIADVNQAFAKALS